MARAWFRTTLAVVILSIAVGGTLSVGPGPARAASVPRPESTTFPVTAELTLNVNSDLYPNYVPGVPMSLVAGYQATPAAHFQEFVGAVWVDLDVATWVVAGQIDNVDMYQATYAIASPTAGGHQYRIQLDGQPGFAGATVNVALVGETVAIGGPATIEAHHAVDLSAGLTGTPIIVAPTGTIEWHDADTHALLETDDLASGTPVRSFTPTVVGVMHFEAVYSGDAIYTPATSPVFLLTIMADTVDTSGVGVDLTAFYPIVDGYRDLVHARGTRLETASVSIRVYNSTNHLVRSLTVASGIGAYSVGWNGRTTTGALAPAGSYRVVQIVTDSALTKKAVSSTVALSWKKIFLASKTIYVTTPTRKTTSWAAWQFTLPSAAVYKSLAFQFYGKSTTVPGLYIGGQDARLCPFTTYGVGCVLSAAAVSFSLGWHAKGLSPTYNRSGRYVRGYVMAGFGGGGVYSAKARLLVTFGILR